MSTAEVKKKADAAKVVQKKSVDQLQLSDWEQLVRDAGFTVKSDIPPPQAAAPQAAEVSSVPSKVDTTLEQASNTSARLMTETESQLNSMKALIDSIKNQAQQMQDIPKAQNVVELEKQIAQENAKIERLQQQSNEAQRIQQRVDALQAEVAAYNRLQGQFDVLLRSFIELLAALTQMNEEVSKLYNRMSTNL